MGEPVPRTVPKGKLRRRVESFDSSLRGELRVGSSGN